MARSALATPRATKAKKYEFSAGTLIEDFENINDWADYGGTGGLFVADTGNFKLGTQSLKWGSVDTTIRKRYKYYAGGADWSGGEFFDLWLYFPTLTTTLPQIQMYVATTNDAAADLTGSGLAVLGAANTGTMRVGVNHFRFKKSDFSATLNWSTVYNVLINLNPLGGAQEVSLDALYVGKRSRPKVVWTLDDGSLNQVNAYNNYFNPRGIQVSIFTNAATIDTAGTTTAQLQAMEANGSEVCNHTYNHTDLTTLATQEEMEDEIRLQKEWMILKGFKNWNLFAYANGNLNDMAVAAVKSQGMKFARTLRGATGGITSWSLENSSLGIANKYAMNAINLNNATTLADALAAVDKAKKFGGTLIFYGHLFDVANGVSTWAIADLEVLLDYAVESENLGELDNTVIGEWFSEFE